MFEFDWRGLLEFYGIDLVFRYPERIWLSWLIFMIWILAFGESLRRRKVLRDPWIIMHLPVAKFPSWRRRVGRWSLLSFAIVLVVVALMVPEKRRVESDRVFEGVRMTFIFDSSDSMPKAEDVKPNRLIASKELVKDMIEVLARDPQLKGRYFLALIPFAGSAQPFFVPFTTSREEFLSSLEEIDENTITKQGTSLWAGVKSFKELLFWYQPRQDTVDIAFVISDGGKEEGREGERKMLPEAFRDLNFLTKSIGNSLGDKEGVSSTINWRTVINTIGVGAVEVDTQGRRTAKPTELVIRDKSGNFMGFYRSDPNNPRGEVLRSRLDEEILQFVAGLGGGEYRYFSEREKIHDLLKKLVLPHRRILDEVSYTSYEPMFSFFLLPAFVILYFLLGYGGWILRILQRMFYLVHLFRRRLSV